MNWSMKSWSELTTDELYELLALRAEVFVVEQTCPFQDLDGLDRRDGVLHLLGREGITWRPMPASWHPALVMTAAPPSAAWSPLPRRGGGLGHRLLAQAVRECEARWPAHSIWLGAQAHLQGFTASMVSWPKGKGIWKMTSLTWGCEGSLPDIVRRQERASGPSPVGHRMVLLPRGHGVVRPG